MPSAKTRIPIEASPTARTLAWESTQEELYELGGADRKNFLNAYVTQDIKNLAVDRTTAAAFLTQKGKLVSTVRVLHLPERILLLFPQGYGAKTEAHLATYLMFADVTLKKLEGEFAHFALAGPKARSLLEARLGLPLEPAAQTVARARWGEAEVLLFPHSDDPERWDLLAPAAAAPMLRDPISAWRKAGELDEAVPEALELRRLELGIPKLGVDMGEDNLVAEVGLDARATSFNKGCYLGQETTARVQSRGHVNRKLTRVRLDQAFSGALPVEVFQGDKKVGMLTSAAESPRYGGWIGLATVALSAWENSEEIYVPLNQKKISLRPTET
ncbi:MAG: hypothetical protein IT573_00135 [Deltaproteobacteria bacterium]|nr:hypothetical protein [Deltaproteobacteria bacterium]